MFMRFVFIIIIIISKKIDNQLKCEKSKSIISDIRWKVVKERNVNLMEKMRMKTTLIVFVFDKNSKRLIYNNVSRLQYYREHEYK